MDELNDLPSQPRNCTTVAAINAVLEHAGSETLRLRSLLRLERRRVLKECQARYDAAMAALRDREIEAEALRELADEHAARIRELEAALAERDERVAFQHETINRLNKTIDTLCRR